MVFYILFTMVFPNSIEAKQVLQQLKKTTAHVGKKCKQTQAKETTENKETHVNKQQINKQKIITHKTS